VWILFHVDELFSSIFWELEYQTYILFFLKDLE
jgi:hypothetical protein